MVLAPVIDEDRTKYRSEVDHQDSALAGASDLIEQFLRLDRYGAIAGAVAAVVANLLIVQEPAVYLVLPFLGALVVALTMALREHRRGNSHRAVWLAALGNWIVALVVAVLFPFLWPVMVLTALMPAVLSMPHFSRAELVPLMVSAAMTGLAVCGVGLSLDDEGLIDDIDDSIELLVVSGGFVAQAGVICLLIWQGNQLHRAALADALRLNQELLASRTRLIDTADRERSRIERDLHDGAQQRLAALGVRLRLFGSGLDGEAKVRVDDLIEELGDATAELRELAHGVYPPLLEQRGLGPAITAVLRRLPGSVASDLDEVGRFDRTVESAIYFVCREAITNAQKHGDGADIRVALSTNAANGPDLVVADTGPGFDDSVAVTGQGLLNMKDRLAAVGGTLVIESRPGRGTTLHASVVPA